MDETTWHWLMSFVYVSRSINIKHFVKDFSILGTPVEMCASINHTIITDNFPNPLESCPKLNIAHDIKRRYTLSWTWYRMDADGDGFGLLYILGLCLMRAYSYPSWHPDEPGWHSVMERVRERRERDIVAWGLPPSWALMRGLHNTSHHHQQQPPRPDTADSQK